MVAKAPAAKDDKKGSGMDTGRFDPDNLERGAKALKDRTVLRIRWFAIWGFELLIAACCKKIREIGAWQNLAVKNTCL